MRKIKEVLRLKLVCGLGERDIAQSCRIARSTVGNYLRRAESAGLRWEEAAELNEDEIEKRLFPELSETTAARPHPDCEHIYQELRRYRNINLTLTQLWLEYKDHHPDGYQYTQFCDYYRRWRGKLDYCMRQEHRGGEKAFIDYCDGIPFINPATGEFIPTQLFVIVWGASNYTYAESTLSQKLPNWIGSHVRSLQYFGCVPHILVPDNLKSGVNEASYYEPEINPTYAEMAEHYGCAVIPARPAHPRDKAKVETGVLIAQRWILSVLRHRTFYSLNEQNAAIRECLEKLNNRLLRKMNKSRRELFESEDRPNALPLPPKPYEYAEWLHATVNIDYHIEIDHHYYSVPFHLLHERLDVRITATTVEAFYKGERVAAHARSYARGLPTTVKEHMPPEHRFFAEWSPTRFIQWASKVGVATAEVVSRIISSRTYPEQAYRGCMGIMQLSRQYDQNRVEAAAKRAIQFNTCSYRSMRSILVSGLDTQLPLETDEQKKSLPPHENVRGPEFYH
jgi:transposase